MTFFKNNSALACFLKNVELLKFSKIGHFYLSYLNIKLKNMNLHQSSKFIKIGLKGINLGERRWDSPLQHLH